jgi:hypothetical protein
MNEEELADLLTQHLDTLLEGGSLPETLPPEVAGLLAVAQSVAETAPKPRPEFGPALKETLVGPLGDNGATPSAGPAFGSPIVMVVVGVGLLAGVVMLALLTSIIIFRNTGSNNAATPAPVQTRTTPTQPAAAPFTPTMTSQPAATPSTPAVTPTPVVDVLPVITVTVEITIQPPALVPGSRGGSGNNGGGNGGGGGGGDHNRGHGNDSDHDDEDNPGKGDDD